MIWDTPKTNTKVQKTNDLLIEPKSGIRRSELADAISTKLVLNRILNVPVELTMGEILGVSKELSGLLAKSIKPKTVSRKDVHLAYDMHRAHEFEAGSF